MTTALHIAQAACAILGMGFAVASLYLIPGWRNVALLFFTVGQSLAILLLPERYSLLRLFIALSALIYINWNYRVLSAELKRKRAELAEKRSKGDARNN